RLRGVRRLVGPPAGVPVDPDADTARRWVEDELARGEYHNGPSLLDRFVRWAEHLFSGVHPTAQGSRLVVVVVVVVLVLLAAGAFWFAGPVRRRRRVAAEPGVFDPADARTSAQIRAAAVEAADRADWTVAVLERFRAVVRALEERALLD